MLASDIVEFTFIFHSVTFSKDTDFTSLWKNMIMMITIKKYVKLSRLQKLCLLKKNEKKTARNPQNYFLIVAFLAFLPESSIVS